MNKTTTTLIYAALPALIAVGLFVFFFMLSAHSAFQSIGLLSIITIVLIVICNTVAQLLVKYRAGNGQMSMSRGLFTGLISSVVFSLLTRLFIYFFDLIKETYSQKLEQSGWNYGIGLYLIAGSVFFILCGMFFSFGISAVLRTRNMPTPPQEMNA